MTHPTPMSDDEVAVRALIERRADALRNKSAAETIATQTADYVQYPLTGALGHAGTTAMTEADFDAIFAGFDGPISYETRDVHVTVGDRVAVSRSLAKISASLSAGADLSMWFRKTLVFEKVDGVWLINHEHESVPISADGSGLAATSLSA